MIWLLLAVLSSTSIFVIFKLLQRFKLPTLQVIIVNYIVATIFGFWLAGGFPHLSQSDLTWLIPAFIIGALFIVNFFLMAYCSQNIGISITTVAGKMSVIIPMVFSIYFYNEDLPILKIIGIVLALGAVFMAVYKKEKGRFSINNFLVPLLIFISMGTTDAIVKYSQDAYVDNSIASSFSASLFAISLIFGLLYLLVKPKNFIEFRRLPIWLAGLILGMVNFGSIYFIILALNSKIFDSSIIFGVVNICIVSLSVIIGRFIFKENLTRINLAGVVLAIAAILILMWS